MGAFSKWHVLRGCVRRRPMRDTSASPAPFDVGRYHMKGVMGRRNGPSSNHNISVILHLLNPCPPKLPPPTEVNDACAIWGVTILLCHSTSAQTDFIR